MSRKTGVHTSFSSWHVIYRTEYKIISALDNKTRKMVNLHTGDHTNTLIVQELCSQNVGLREVLLLGTEIPGRRDRPMTSLVHVDDSVAGFIHNFSTTCRLLLLK
jgi:hypothetical protein